MTYALSVERDAISFLIHYEINEVTLVRVNFFLLSVFLITSCGGGGDTSSGTDSPAPSPTPIANFTPGMTPDPAPTATPSSNATPMETPSSNPTPMITPTPNQEIFEVAVQLNSGNLTLNWTDISANSYRVLIWSGDSAPLVFSSIDTDLETAIAPGDYTLIVEAYDELGNSVFSDPEFIEVQQ